MTRLLTRLSILTIALSLTSISPALADKFSALPKLDGKRSKNLQIRFVQYDGSTNGAMIVDVKNTGKRAEVFTSEGLYFVPTGDPEKAPQRLGAGGPFAEIALTSTSGQSAAGHKQKLTVKPGQTRRLALEVFCIDSHRASPSSDTKFTLAAKRMPKKLRSEINVGNQAILRKNKGDVRKAKSAIQSNMWQTRDKKWIKLQGERKNEKKARPRMQMNNRNVRQRRIRRQRVNNVDFEVQQQQSP